MSALPLVFILRRRARRCNELGWISPPVQRIELARSLSPSRLRVVGFVANLRFEHSRKSLEGLHRFVTIRSGWRLRLHDAMPLIREPGERTGLVGLVVGSLTRDVLDSLRKLDLPIVTFSNREEMEGVPGALSDDRAVGQLAAMDFLRRGYRHFAFLHGERFRFSRQREEGFLSALPENSHRESFALKSAGDAVTCFRRWGRPVAVLADSDEAARLFIEELLRCGVRIPAEVAVLGVNNDPIDQVLSPVALSSIELGSEVMGYEAGRMLERLMRRGRIAGQPTLIPPRQIVHRRSTKSVAVRDARVAGMLQLLNESPGRWESVEQLIAKTGVPRRTMEAAFRRELGVSPHEEWTNARLDHAKTLLVTSQDTLESIAGDSGFSDAHSLCIAFKRVFGITPGTYRKLRQPGE